MATCSSPQTLTRLSSLPYELRRYIYLLCTPPRIVYIPLPSHAEEVRVREQFNFPSRTVIPDLHPDVAYFSNSWRHRVSYLSMQQPTLEHYGFTTNKHVCSPWEPTYEVPEIHLHTLHEEPEFAYALFRDLELRSCAEIPVFLHVCRESRQTLQDYGYELAFAGRSSPPKVWFHFDRDTLYLERRAEYMFEETVSTLCNTEWSVSAFPPSDLRRLKLVALTSPESYDLFDDMDCVKLLDALQYLPNLRKLTLVSVDTDDFLDLFTSGPWGDSVRESEAAYSTKSLTSVPNRDIDILFWTKFVDQKVDPGFFLDVLSYYRSQDLWPDIMPFFTAQRREFPTRLQRISRAHYGFSPTTGDNNVRVPDAVDFSIICPSDLAHRVSWQRRGALRDVDQMRNNCRINARKFTGRIMQGGQAHMLLKDHVRDDLLDTPIDLDSIPPTDRLHFHLIMFRGAFLAYMAALEREDAEEFVSRREAVPFRTAAMLES